MKLFVWRSETIKNHGPGTIAASAPDAEAARAKIRAAFDGHLREGFLSWALDMPDDEDAAAQIAEARRKLEADLETEPEIRDVLFISGSE